MTDIPIDIEAIEAEFDNFEMDREHHVIQMLICEIRERDADIAKWKNMLAVAHELHQEEIAKLSAPSGADVTERARKLSRDYWGAANADLDRFVDLAINALQQYGDERAAAAREAAIEEAAQVIEQNQESHRSSATEDGYYLSPRRRGNLAGLAYAEGVRALAAKPGSK